MNSQSNHPAMVVIQSLYDWFASPGGIIPVFLVFCGLTILVLMSFIFRAIWRGGLKPQSTTNFFRRQQMAERFCQPTNHHE